VAKFRAHNREVVDSNLTSQHERREISDTSSTAIYSGVVMCIN